MFVIIAAIGENRELGKDNKLIWYLPSDLTFFKEKTMGKKIVMGRKTFESLPRFLQGRIHYVLTHHKDRQLITPIPNVEELINSQDIILLDSDDFMDFVDKYKNTSEEIMVIGGDSVYKLFMDHNLVKKMFLTRIKAKAEADAFFPAFNENEWNSSILDEKEESGIKYEHAEYIKKQ